MLWKVERSQKSRHVATALTTKIIAIFPWIVGGLFLAMADAQAQELYRVGRVDLQGLGAQFDLVTEHHGHLEGVTRAAEEAQRRRPPGDGALRHIGSGRGRHVLAEHDGAQLRARRLSERMVLRHREQRGDLHLGDGAAHAPNRRWAVTLLRPGPGNSWLIVAP